MRKLVWILLLTSAAYGQANFEVASIKLNDSGSHNSSTNGSKGELQVQNSTLKNLIQGAYNVREYSFSGPDWLSGVRFDVVAKYPPEPEGLTRETRQELRRQMMQNLLTERFHLTTHWESKMLSGYALVLAKKGLKIEGTESTGSTSISNNNGSLHGTGMNMKQLANSLSGVLGAPVDDQTQIGVKVFKIDLEWTADDNTVNNKPDAVSDGKPTIFTAVQEVLGLRLEGRKVPVQILVVDKIDRTPTEN